MTAAAADAVAPDATLLMFGAALAHEPAELDMAVLPAWSIVHGLTMLVIDGLASSGASPFVPEHVDRRTARLLLDGPFRR